MTHDTKQTDLGAVAQASYAAARDGLALTGPNKAGHVSAVASGLVDLLVDRAAQSAGIAPLVLDMTPGASRQWADILAALADCGLSPALFCGRTGRPLGHVSPDHFADYLNLLDQWGDCRASDDVARRLLDAVICTKAHARAASVLHTCGASLAVMRQADSCGYLVRALSDYCLPMPRGAGSLALAARAENLGAAWVAVRQLPPAVVAYACEVVGLLLSYVDTRSVRFRILEHYGRGAAVDFAAMLASPATVGHLCGRIVQGLVSLLSEKRLRPMSQISARDLLALRVDYAGVPEFVAARAELRGLRALGVASALRETRRIDRVFKMTARDDAALVSPMGRALADVFDLALLAGVTGRRVSIAVDSAAQVAQVGAARDAMADIRAAIAADELPLSETDFGAFDVGALIASGALDQSALVYDMPDDGPELDLMGALADALSGLDMGGDDLPGDDLAAMVQTARPVARGFKPTKADKLLAGLDLASFGLADKPAPLPVLPVAPPVPGPAVPGAAVPAGSNVIRPAFKPFKPR